MHNGAVRMLWNHQQGFILQKHRVTGWFNTNYSTLFFPLFRFNSNNNLICFCRLNLFHWLFDKKEGIGTITGPAQFWVSARTIVRLPSPANKKRASQSETLFLAEPKRQISNTFHSGLKRLIRFIYKFNPYLQEEK